MRHQWLMNTKKWSDLLGLTPFITLGRHKIMAKKTSLNSDRSGTARAIQDLREKASKLIKQWKRPENLFVLNAQKAAFVIIDMQNFSCAPVDGVALPRIGTVVTQINRLADFCREKGIPVIWVRQNITSTGTLDDAGLYSLFHDKDHAESTMNRGNGTEIYSDMHVDPSCDHIVFKNRYIAFLSNPPELREKIDSLKRKQLIVAGIAANVCVESTIRDAMQLDYEVLLVSDGVTAADDVLLESTLTNMRLFFGDVRTAKEIMEELANKTT